MIIMFLLYLLLLVLIFFELKILEITILNKASNNLKNKILVTFFLNKIMAILLDVEILG